MNTRRNQRDQHADRMSPKKLKYTGTTNYTSKNHNEDNPNDGDTVGKQLLQELNKAPKKHK